jgi:putative SOS response-associated peptidase YedK
MRYRASPMCNLYHVGAKEDFKVYVAKHAARWVIPYYAMRTVGPNQDSVFFVATEDAYVGQVEQWGLIRPGQPERIDYLPSKVPGKRGRPRCTNNARIEGIEKKVTFKAAHD